jgi:hypothetical protein
VPPKKEMHNTILNQEEEHVGWGAIAYAVIQLCRRQRWEDHGLRPAEPKKLVRLHLKKQARAKHRWLMPIILAT